MSRKRASIDRLSAETRRRAQGEAALLQAELRKLRGRLSNIDALARVPHIRPKRTYTKKTTESLLEDLSLLTAADIAFSIGASVAGEDARSLGYTGGQQAAARVFDAYASGLRAR